jgi:hypothetical protein
MQEEHFRPGENSAQFLQRIRGGHGATPPPGKKPKGPSFDATGGMTNKTNPFAGGVGLRQALAPMASVEEFITKNPNLSPETIKKATKDYIGYGFDAAMRKGKLEGRKALMQHLNAKGQSEAFISAVMKDFDNKISSQRSDVFGKGDEIVDRGFGGHVGGKSDHATQSNRMVDLYRPKSGAYMGKDIKGSMQRSNILGAEQPVIEVPSSRLAPVVARGSQRGGLGASSLPPVRKYNPNPAPAKQAPANQAGTAREFFQRGGSNAR